MKQKRTVKSLLPNKYKVGERFFTVLLLTLSVMLCIGAATLMTTSVGAAEETTSSNNIYSGYDDKVEVLYRMEFSDPEKLYDEGAVPVENFYMENNILYVSPSMVKVKDADNTGAHSFLGGEGNRVKSDNVTMLAGYKNIVENNNDNSSVLGGSENVVEGSNRLPDVIAGGKGNKMSNNGELGVILGGIGNEVSYSKNSAILGGENNNINHAANAIIGGKMVTGIVDNIFAFSNSDSGFEPRSSKAFYLNLTNGVGINADSEKTGMAVGGAVGFGSVDGETCNANNIGVEGILTLGNYGCLVGCTKKSGGKWELLDRGENCEKACKVSNNCMSPSEDSSDENQNYTGYCSQEIPDGSIRCTTGEWESYTNVIFQTLKVESQDDCEKVGDNKCAYYCEGGDCDLPDAEPENPVTPPEDPVNEFKCTGEAPSADNHKVSKDGSNSNLTKNVAWHYAENESDIKCGYVCSEGFVYNEETDKCESTVSFCRVPKGEDGLKYDIKPAMKECHSDVIIKYCITPVCDCKEGYIKSGDICVLANKCVGTPPQNAYFITGSDEGLSEDTQRQVIPYSEVEKTKKCAYLCESGYVAKMENGVYTCLKCDEGSRYDPESPDVCVTDSECTGNYIVNPDGTGCVLRGVCTYGKNGPEYAGGSLGNIVGKIVDLYPNSNKNYSLTCVDGDGYKGDVEPNTCTFQCKTGYYCFDRGNGDYVCQEPSCRHLSKDNGVDYYYHEDHPGHYNFTQKGLVFGTGVTTSGEFHEKYKDKIGCFYWCPEENHYTQNTSVKDYCGSTSTAASNKNHCSSFNFVEGYSVYVTGATRPDQDWVYTLDYDAVINKSGSCNWSCEPGAEKLDTRMTQSNETNYGYPSKLFLDNTTAKICYKNCLNDGKYMGNNGKCYSCQEGYKLDESQLGTGVINGVTYQEYRGCVPDCPEGAEWRYLQNKTYACVFTKALGSCPKGYVSDSNYCYKCLSNSEIYEPGEGCVKK